MGSVKDAGLIEILEPDFVFGDARGRLVQLVREGIRQVNVVTSKANVTRGGHYHKINREMFYVVQGRLVLTARQGEKSERREFSAGDFFAVPPLVAHDFFYEEDSVLVALYDQGVELDETRKDIYPG